MSSYFRIISSILIIILAELNHISTVNAQSSSPNQITAFKTDGLFSIDGNMIEPEWNAACKIDNFTQRELLEDDASSERTEAAVVYTNNSLLIGVWCYDSLPEQIIAKQMKRDFDSDSDDNIIIYIDTYHDKRSGYRFTINPNGARGDAILIDDGKNSNEDWNGVWDCAVEMNNEGWFAEIEIPFNTLKFPDNPKQTWGFNIERNIRSRNEKVFWQGWSRDNSFISISNAGTLIGLENISSGRHAEIMPFFTAGFEKTNNEKMEFVKKFGGDLKYLITPTLKLNLTFNTDFAQVESDKAEVNLTRFSISHPEKREFFLEGKNFFDFNMGEDNNIFYSRRIGLGNKEEIPIVGGAKITGKMGGSNLGFLSIQTLDKDSIPSTNYTVFRFRQDILEQSNIGLIVTAKNSAQGSNYVYGLDGNYSTSKLFGDKNLTVGGLIAQSQTSTMQEDNNIAYHFYISYPNDFIEYDFSYTNIPNDFNPEVGFLKRKNFKHMNMELQINPRPDFIPWINKAQVKPIDADFYFSDDTNELESAEFEWRPFGFSTVYGDFMEFNIQRSFDRLDEDFEIFHANYIPMGNYWYTHYEIQLESFEGRKISVDGKINWGDFYNGSRTLIECELYWNLNNHLNLSTSFEKNIIKLPVGDFTTNEIGARIEYAFTTKLYTSFYGQWNNDDDEMNLNFRINWIPRIGSDFYLVVNQKYSGSDFKFDDRNLTVLAKLVWRFIL